jgi:hypothetical protein
VSIAPPLISAQFKMAIVALGSYIGFNRRKRVRARDAPRARLAQHAGGGADRCPHSRCPASRQLDLPTPASWGGRRAGAGRKLSPRPPVPHRPRPNHDVRHPVHVTLRGRRGLPSLRSPTIFSALRGALRASSRGSFRVIHFSVQVDHVHLMVEADIAGALRRGIQGLAIRCARAVNRAADRHGSVWSGRHHTRALPTPREVRHGMVYVLLNFRKHLRAPAGVDPCSSGPWFDGWTRSSRRADGAPPTAAPRTWLAAVGWRRAGGAIDCHESPAAQDGPRPAGRGTRSRLEFFPP